MLTSDLQNKIDEKWNACWPISKLRPIVILDLISYLFFIKKITKDHLTGEIEGNKPDNTLRNSKNEKHFKGSFSIDPEDQIKLPLFGGEYGNHDLKINYSLDSNYGLFVKGDVLMAPTHKLKDTAEEILEIIEKADEHSKGEIFDHLLNKVELTGTNGHVYLPDFLAELIVSIIQPSKKDFILNVAAGTGNLLTGCTKYISRKNTRNSLYNFDSRKFAGLESDLTSLRIAAMNMILHGLHNPELKIFDTNTPLKNIIVGQPSVIVANLIFASADDKTNIEINSGNEITNKEIHYLNFILKNLEAGTRAVIVVHDIVLYHISTGFISIRREIVDKCNLDTILYLGGKKKSLFSGTSILIFSKEETAKTDKVWFYKIEPDELNRNNGTIFSENSLENDEENFPKQKNEFKNILLNFKNKDNKKESAKQDGFYINVDEIRSNDYKLSYKEYHLIKNEFKLNNFSNPSPPVTKEIIDDTANRIPIKPFSDEIKEITKKDKTDDSKVLLKPIVDETKDRVNKSKADNDPPPRTNLDETKEVINVINPIAAKIKKTTKKDKTTDSKTPLKPIADEKKKITKKGIKANTKFPLDPIAHERKESIKKDTTSDNKIPLKLIVDETKEVMNDIKAVGKIPLNPISNEKKEANKIITNPTFIRTSPKTQLFQKMPVKKIILLSGLAILFICIAYWRLVYKNDDISQEASASISVAVPDSAKKPSVINPASKQVIDSIVNVINNYATKDSANRAETKYTVISKAYFYNSPDQNTKQKLFISNLSNDTLTPIKENNGFIFVDYNNKNGKSTEGWLNKNDLIAALTEVTESIINKKGNVAETKYRTKSNAYFYRQPDIKKRSSLYLGQSNPTILTPLKENNGFVYVIYTNTRGRTTKGWLNKKNLRPVK